MSTEFRVDEFVKEKERKTVFFDISASSIIMSVTHPHFSLSVSVAKKERTVDVCADVMADYGRHLWQFFWFSVMMAGKKSVN